MLDENFLWKESVKVKRGDDSDSSNVSYCNLIFIYYTNTISIIITIFYYFKFTMYRNFEFNE